MGKTVKTNELESLQAYNIIKDNFDPDLDYDDFVRCKGCKQLFLLNELNDNRVCIDCQDEIK